jgi:hypothetical protein
MQIGFLGYRFKDPANSEQEMGERRLDDQGKKNIPRPYSVSWVI